MTEAGAIIQWMRIVADRRGSNPEAADHRAQQWASEKEFLLIHSNSIDANPEGITADDGSEPPEFADWIGRGTLIKAEETLGRPRKLIFNHHEWPDHDLPPDLGQQHQPQAGLQPNYLTHNHNH